MRQRHTCITLLLGTLLVCLVGGASAGVRVVDDEVVFTLRAPEAHRVFLVGSFNNWNPTLERMDREGDAFVVRLYLLAGTYRYKFVVDDEWGVDPDNVPSDPKLGSVLVLEERSGMLVMGSDEAVETETEVRLEPNLRYIGALHADDGDAKSDHALDFYFTYESKRLRANVDFKTTNDSWEADPLRARVWFNNGFVELKFGEALFSAFENGTIWRSNDPFRLVGDVGVFDYDVGRLRKGLAFESQEILKTRLRVMYADKVEERLLAPVVIPSGAFGDFDTSTSADTSVYRYDTNLADEDTWAFDLAVDLGGFDLGYVNRRNRGMHPGLLTRVLRGSGVYGLTTFNTREFWGADVLWLDWRFYDGLSVGGAFGRSSARVEQTAQSVLVASALPDVGIGQNTMPTDTDIPLQSSTRFDGSLGYAKDKLNVAFVYRWNEFDFDPFVYAGSKAQIGAASLSVEYRSDRWSTGGRIRYIDQDYGDTPVDFHYATPARNFWLDWGDALDVTGQVQFDMRRATDLALTFGWNDRVWNPARRLGPVPVFALFATIEGVADEFFGSVEYVGARIDAEYGITDNLYVDAHARAARYDKPSWQARKTYIASYLEFGYRTNRVELSIGLGPDPIVLDPVPNELLNNGWEQALRAGIPADVTRNQWQELGVGLLSQEQLLQDDHAIKLELIVFF